MTTDAAARPTFYQGQYLGPDDLAAMVDYATDRAACHDLGAHTWGVGAGLQVIASTAAGAVEYWVQPGVAWDGFGRTLLLATPVQITPELLRSVVYDPVADATGGPGQLVDVWLRWRVDATAPAPAGFADCTDGGFSRELERVEVVVRNVADVADTRQQLDVGGLLVDATEAIGAWYPTGVAPRPTIEDASVPFQRFPSGTDPSMWLVPIGVLRWKVAAPGSTGALGTFQPLQPGDAALAVQRRRLVGVVAGTVLGSEGLLRLRSRHVPAPTVWTDEPLWLEGTTRVDGDVRLFGGPDERARGGIDFRDGGGGDAGRRVRLGRHDRGVGTDLRLQLGATGSAATRFVVGTETPPAAPTDPPVFADAVVVRSDGRVGIGVASPADGPTHPLHVVSPMGIRQSALHVTGAPGRSSLAYNAFHDEANAKWIADDPQRSSATIELDDFAGVPRFAVYTAPPTNAVDTPPAWRLGLHFNGTRNHLGLGGGAIDEATVVVNDAVESSVRLATAQSAVRRATVGITGTDAYLATLQADISLRTDGTTKLIVKEDGKVGVGTTTPTNALHVSGRPTDEDSGNIAAHVALIENTSTTNAADVLALRVGAGPAAIGELNNFITFFAANTPVGRIEQTTLTDGTRALRLSSPGADFAESMPVADGEQVEPGDVVAVVGGEVTRRTDGATWISVVTDRAVVLGNAGSAGDGRAAVTIVGQVPVRVDGPAGPGDLLLPSGRGDGRASACPRDVLLLERAGEVFAEVVTVDDAVATALVGTGARSAALIAVLQRMSAGERGASAGRLTVLTIDRLEVACAVASDHPAPDAVAARLRAVGERRVGASLGRLLARSTVAGDERVVLLRRLEVRLGVDVGSDDAAIAEALAAAIAAGLRSGVAGADSIVEFVDPVDQLARLLVDLAAGLAWDRWYHRHAFAGLVHLPPSTAVRTLAEHQPARFAAATERLTMRSLGAVTAAVHPADAARILAASPATATTTGATVVGDLVAEIVAESPERAVDPLFVVLVARRQVGAAVDDIVAALDELVAGRGEPSVTIRPAAPTALERAAGSPAASDRSAAVPSGRTPFGALFLLLPYLAEAARFELLTTVADRLAVAAAIAGPGAAADPVVAALLADVAGESAVAAVSTAAARADHATATLTWLRAVLAVGPAELGVHVVRRRGSCVAIVVDEPTGHWIAVRRGAGIRTFRALLDEHPAVPDVRRAVLVGDTLRFLRLADAEVLVTAANILRRFAAGLPGFALAGVGHLWREALDADAVVTPTRHGWHVVVERPPLAEILRICGHGDRSTALAWQPDRTVRVEIRR